MLRLVRVSAAAAVVVTVAGVRVDDEVAEAKGQVQSLAEQVRGHNLHKHLHAAGLHFEKLQDRKEDTIDSLEQADEADATEETTEDDVGKQERVEEESDGNQEGGDEQAAGEQEGGDEQPADSEDDSDDQEFQEGQYDDEGSQIQMEGPAVSALGDLQYAQAHAEREVAKAQQDEDKSEKAAAQKIKEAEEKVEQAELAAERKVAKTANELEKASELATADGGQRGVQAAADAHPNDMYNASADAQIIELHAHKVRKDADEKVAKMKADATAFNNDADTEVKKLEQEATAIRDAADKEVKKAEETVKQTQDTADDHVKDITNRVKEADEKLAKAQHLLDSHNAQSDKKETATERWRKQILKSVNCYRTVEEAWEADKKANRDKEAAKEADKKANDAK